MKSFPEVLVPSVPVTIELDTAQGKQLLHFKIAYDFDALPLAEAKLGVSLLNGRVFAKITANVIAVMFWAGIQKFHPEYEGEDGLKAIRSFISLRNSAVISDAVQEAYVLSLPDDQQKLIRDMAALRGKVKDPNVNAAPATA